MTTCCRENYDVVVQSSPTSPPATTSTVLPPDDPSTPPPWPPVLRADIRCTSSRPHPLLLRCPWQRPSSGVGVNVCDCGRYELIIWWIIRSSQSALFISAVHLGSAQWNRLDCSRELLPSSGNYSTRGSGPFYWLSSPSTPLCFFPLSSCLLESHTIWAMSMSVMAVMAWDKPDTGDVQ